MADVWQTFPAQMEEHRVLIEDKLADAVAAKGGVEVGRMTVDGKRYFTFYGGAPRVVEGSDGG